MHGLLWGYVAAREIHLKNISAIIEGEMKSPLLYLKQPALNALFTGLS